MTSNKSIKYLDKLINHYNEKQGIIVNRDIKNLHLAMILQNGKPLNEIKINYLRNSINGYPILSLHAEMAVIHNLLNSLNEYSFGYYNQFIQQGLGKEYFSSQSSYLRDRETKKCIL